MCLYDTPQLILGEDPSHVLGIAIFMYSSLFLEHLQYSGASMCLLALLCIHFGTVTSVLFYFENKILLKCKFCNY
jgi:hypothetical protein